MSEELVEVLTHCLSARQAGLAKKAGDSLKLYLGGWLLSFARAVGKNREDAIDSLAHRLAPETLAELVVKAGGAPVTLEHLLPALYAHSQEQLEKAFSRAVGDAMSDLSIEVEEALRSVDRSLLSVAVPASSLEGACMQLSAGAEETSSQRTLAQPPARAASLSASAQPPSQQQLGRPSCVPAGGSGGLGDVVASEGDGKGARRGRSASRDDGRGRQPDYGQSYLSPLRERSHHRDHRSRSRSRSHVYLHNRFSASESSEYGGASEMLPTRSGPDVSHERDGSMRVIGRILGFRVGQRGRNLELQVVWMDGAVGWHHPKMFTWGSHNYRPMLRYIGENMAAVNAELARSGFNQYVDGAGHLRDLQEVAAANYASGIASTPTSASLSVVPTPAAQAGPGKRAPVVIVTIDDYRIGDRDALELHTIWGDASTAWLDTKVDCGAALALRNAYLQPRRDQINRELFKRGRLFFVKDNGQPTRCSMSAHPGKCLPDVGAPPREQVAAQAAAPPPAAAHGESDPRLRRR